MDKHTNRRRFLSLCDEFIHRDGLDKLLEWLEKSDFFSAPASTKYHGAYDGGLCQHSLNVYDCMMDITKNSSLGKKYPVNDESATIVSLFHDMCKVNFYKPDTRNVKVNGVWTVVPTYSIDEKFVYGGHGSKSVFIIERFMKLLPDEAIAINCHMGSWDGDKYVSAAYQNWPLAWFVHVADEAASFLVESEETTEDG